MARVHINPQFAVIDDEIEIVVSGIESNSPVTINASVVYFKVLYIGYGHFYSDSQGTVNLKTHASYGGTYSGVQSMGLFNSMRAMPSKHAYPRLLIKGSVEEGLDYKVSVWKGHLTQDQVHQLHLKYILPGAIHVAKTHFLNHVLCQGDLKRSYLSPTVKRIPIKTQYNGDTICGVLFLPEGEGPFPGVIDMFGGAGGCVEIRASLLAKHGYATLALAYFAYEGLKAQSYAEFEMSYFDKAVDWLSKHPKVKPGGISMVGVCLGGQVVLLTAVRNKSVRCAICINSNMIMSANSDADNPLLEFLFLPQSYRNLSQIYGGMLSANVDCPAKMPRPPLHYDHDNPILFMVGEHDNYKQCVDDAIDQLRRSGKKRVVKKFIKGQGHLIEPPYMPLCFASPSPSGISGGDEYDPLVDSVAYDWNGDYRRHGNSQIEAWNILLDFLQKHSGAMDKSKL